MPPPAEHPTAPRAGQLPVRQLPLDQCPVTVYREHDASKRQPSGPPRGLRQKTTGRAAPHPTPWSTPGLVETRFSPDALVWVAVVFHGTAAWRNHGLIILPLLFIEY